jgi:deoxycytidylate deaminase
LVRVQPEAPFSNMNNKQFNRLVDIARALKIEKHKSGPCFHISFLVRKGKIIEIGTNHYKKTNRISATYKCTREYKKDYIAGIHSEMDALGKGKSIDDFSKIEMINIRINNNGEVDNSIPCPNCAFYLGQYNLKRVWYTDAKGTLTKFP